MSEHGFATDPFDPAHAGIRAGAQDRDELARILGDAYADGKLDAEEYRERLDAAMEIKFLGEVRTLLIDLGDPTALVRYRPRPDEGEDPRDRVVSTTSAAGACSRRLRRSRGTSSAARRRRARA